MKNITELKQELASVNNQLADTVRHAAVRLPIRGFGVKQVCFWSQEEQQRAERGLNAILHAFQSQFHRREKLLELIAEQEGKRFEPCASTMKLQDPS